MVIEATDLESVLQFYRDKPILLIQAQAPDDEKDSFRTSHSKGERLFKH